MSYASVAASDAPPQSQQPRPNPALLTTTPPTHPAIADDAAKVNIVGPDFKDHPRTYTSEAREIIYNDTGNSYSPPSPKSNEEKEPENECYNVWETTKCYLLQPGVAGGLIGIVNIGVFATMGRTFYAQPELRRNTSAISSAVAASIALFSIEGFAADRYRKTPQGREEERKAKKEGALIYRHLHEQIMRPGVLGGLVGLVNSAILGALGYVAYSNWNKPWDRRAVSAISVGLLTIWGGEGILVEKLSSHRRK